MTIFLPVGAIKNRCVGTVGTSLIVLMMPGVSYKRLTHRKVNVFGCTKNNYLFPFLETTDTRFKKRYFRCKELFGDVHFQMANGVFIVWFSCSETELKIKARVWFQFGFWNFLWTELESWHAHAGVCSTETSCSYMGPRLLIYPILSYPIHHTKLCKSSIAFLKDYRRLYHLPFLAVKLSGNNRRDCRTPKTHLCSEETHLLIFLYIHMEHRWAMGPWVNFKLIKRGQGIWDLRLSWRRRSVCITTHWHLRNEIESDFTKLKYISSTHRQHFDCSLLDCAEV